MAQKAKDKEKERKKAEKVAPSAVYKPLLRVLKEAKKRAEGEKEKKKKKRKVESESESESSDDSVGTKGLVGPLNAYASHSSVLQEHILP